MLRIVPDIGYTVVAVICLKFLRTQLNNLEKKKIPVDIVNIFW